MSGPLAHLDALERALAAKGFPAMSPWWRETVDRFYRSGRRQLVLRVGRRGGKSSTLSRVAVLEALYGEHVITPGDVGVVGIVSVSRDEANQRLRTVKAILDALGVAYKPIEGGIELLSKPVIFKVFAASVAGVVGGTWICAICDEVARWKDTETGANPAKEVLGSLRPTMATQPNARIFLSSSPLGSLDAHAVAFDDGEAGFQCCAYAATWVANPSVTEGETHALEPDERIWRREYAAIPQSGVLGAFDMSAVDRAFAKTVGDATNGGEVLIVDPSSGGADSFTYCATRFCWPAARRWLTRTSFVAGRRCVSYLHDAASKRIPDPNYKPSDSRPFLRLEAFQAVEGGFWGQIGGDAIVRQIAGFAASRGIKRAFGDQRESLMLTAAFAQHGITYTPIAWTASNKPTAVERVRALMRDNALSLEPDAKLRAELLQFEERINATGQITFAARRGGHDDRVALLITAALAETEGGLPSSPAKPGPYRYIPPWHRA